MRTVPLTAVKDGINRLLMKGAARADSLIELTNGYINAERKIVVRPGTTRLATVAGTVGLVYFDGSYHVFSHTTVAVPGGFTLDILLHPLDPAATLTRIHFVTPVLGALYVVAEFDDGQIYHYWLQEGEAWEATVEIAANEFRTPTVANGYVYRATRLGSSYPAWTAGTPRTIGDLIEPTTYNEYYFEAVDTQGDNPASGSTEPPWPTETGEQIVESTDGVTFPNANDAAPPAPPSPNTPQASTTDRYEL